MSHLKILTLNCWAIPIPLKSICQFRKKRIDALSAELQKGKYDIILLQEIWYQRDYEKLVGELSLVYPYTHYWHSGVLGSGVCMFSKHVILETFQHVYMCNGYAHKIFHGDWYGSKLVGLAKVKVDDLCINVYATHLHASYGVHAYIPHRTAQAFELSQFIKLTSETCDLAILAGDLNFTPSDIQYKITCMNANLLDSWIEQRDDKGYQFTSDVPSNSFTTEQSGGHCIDYIFYRSNSGIKVSCEKCNVTLNKIPGETFNYSDHEGVEAEFNVRKMLTASAPTRQVDQINDALLQAQPILDRGIKSVKLSSYLYMAVFFLCVCFLMSSVGVYYLGANILGVLCDALLALFGVFCLWMGAVSSQQEINGLTAAKKNIQQLLVNEKIQK